MPRAPTVAALPWLLALHGCLSAPGVVHEPPSDDDTTAADDDTGVPDDDSTPADDDTEPSDDDSTPADDDSAAQDADGDGWSTAAGDCDDGAAGVHPGAKEVCGDGVDDDCDGSDATCGFEGEFDLSDADAILTGPTAGGQAGYSVAAAGDVDGDGSRDVLVGAPYDGTFGTSAGAAYLVSGPVAGDVDLGLAGARFYGEDGGDLLGSAVAGAGDLDADGYDDVVIGAWGYGSYNGAVLVFSGPVGGDLGLVDATARLATASPYDRLGYSVAGVGDVDDDGFGDVLVGAYADDTAGASGGAAYLVRGPVEGVLDLAAADARLYAAGEMDNAGWAVAGAGDVDGDGFDDLLVSAPYADPGGAQTGAAYLVLGPVSGDLDLAEADAILSGESEGDRAGAALAPAGDVNDDGYDDILVGSPSRDDGATNTGCAYLVLGPVYGAVSLAGADAKRVGHAESDQAGTSVAAAGDLDGDGYGDVLIGAIGADGETFSTGVAYLVRGPFGGTADVTTADARLVGQSMNDRAGAAVAGVGDVDGDGADDVLVGAPWADLGGTDAGVVYMVGGGAG
ncbi:integrin alpha [Myxococcota bacterium]|nr:integrin alpha [Myxococcota bacterium]